MIVMDGEDGDDDDYTVVFGAVIVLFFSLLPLCYFCRLILH